MFQIYILSTLSILRLGATFTGLFVCSVRSPSTRGTPVSSLCVMRYARCLLVKIMTMTISISISITFIFFLVSRNRALALLLQAKPKEILLVLVPI